MQKVVAFCKSDVYYMSSPVGSDATGSEGELRFQPLRYLIDILYTNTLLMNLSNSSWSQKQIKLKSLILAQIERWWYA